MRAEPWAILDRAELLAPPYGYRFLSRYSIVALDYYVPGETATQLRALNPAVKVFRWANPYRASGAAFAGNEDTPENVQPTWVLRQQDDTLIRHQYLPGTPTLMDVRNPQWLAYWVGDQAAKIVADNLDGLISAGNYRLARHWAYGPGGQPPKDYDEGLWDSLARAFLQYTFAQLQAARPATYVEYQGLHREVGEPATNRTNYLALCTGAVYDAFGDVLDGATPYVRIDKDDTTRGWFFLDLVTQVVGANALNRRVFINARLSNPDSLVERAGIVAAQMMATQGNVFLRYESPTAPLWFPEFEYEFGAALGGFRVEPSGVYRRDFERGTVVFNLTSSPQNVSLAGPFDRLTTGTRVSSFSLPALRGEILMKPADQVLGTGRGNGELMLNAASQWYYSPSFALLDRSKCSGEWLLVETDQFSDVLRGNTNPADTNKDGWYTGTIPATGIGFVFCNLPTPIGHRTGLNYMHEKGLWVWQCDGSGTVEIWDNGRPSMSGPVTFTGGSGRRTVNCPTGNERLCFIIRSQNGGDPIRNIRCFPISQEDRHLAGKLTSDHYEAMIRRLGVKALRLMGWGNTTGQLLFNSGQPVAPQGPQLRSWSQRRVLNSALWGSEFTSKPGLPVEAMVAVCNELDVDLWYCMPMIAAIEGDPDELVQPAPGDGYANQVLIYVRDNLKPHLRLMLEWQNEVWNAGFMAYFHCLQEADRLGLFQGLEFWERTARFYARKSKKMADLATTIFAGQTHRLVRVAAGWGGDYTNNQWRLEQGHAQSADVFVTANYFGNEMWTNPAWVRGATVPQIIAELDRGAAGVVTDHIERIITVRNEADTRVAAAFGLPWGCYEGGTHINLAYPPSPTPTDIAKVTAAVRDEDYKRITLRLHNDTRTRRGAVFQCHFQDVAAYDVFYWGIEEHSLADQAPYSPRMRAMAEFGNAGATQEIVSISETRGLVPDSGSAADVIGRSEVADVTERTGYRARTKTSKTEPVGVTERTGYRAFGNTDVGALWAIRVPRVAIASLALGQAIATAVPASRDRSVRTATLSLSAIVVRAVPAARTRGARTATATVASGGDQLNAGPPATRERSAGVAKLVVAAPTDPSPIRAFAGPARRVAAARTASLTLPNVIVTASTPAVRLRSVVLGSLDTKVRQGDDVRRDYSWIGSRGAESITDPTDIYLGAACGWTADGFVHVLRAGDLFTGFAAKRPTQGDDETLFYFTGIVTLEVVGADETTNSRDVFAIGGDTFTVDPASGGTRIGRQVIWLATRRRALVFFEGVPWRSV